MNRDLRLSTLRYYEKRAPDYDEAYLGGTGTSSIANPSVFTKEATELAEVVRGFAGGRLLDLACGTAFWLPHYIDRSPEVTLFDQSASMLDRSLARVTALGVVDRCILIRGDVLDYEFPQASFDRALVGFLVSHLTPEQEEPFFAVLRRALRPSGRFLILDSAWTPMRAAVNQKIEDQTRRLNDGTEFTIYKRYLERQDIKEWQRRFGVNVVVEYFGDAFVAVSGTFAGNE